MTVKKTCGLGTVCKASSTIVCTVFPSDKNIARFLLVMYYSMELYPISHKEVTSTRCLHVGNNFGGVLRLLLESEFSVPRKSR